MASFTLFPTIAESLVNGVVVPETAARVRKSIYGHRRLGAADMDLVFCVARKAGPNPCTEWVQLFSQAVTDYVVHQSDPEDYISEENAQWLIGELKAGGGIGKKAEFAMLMEVMRSALEVPISLSVFCLKEIKTAIVSGRRGAIGGEDHLACSVGPSDVQILRAVLFAATTGSPCHITREEAEVLFEIAHSTAGHADPAFDDLFARAVGNYLLSICPKLPSGRQALHRDKWLDERESTAGFLSRVFSRSAMSLFDSLKSPLELAEEDLSRIEAQDAAELAYSERVTQEEGAWVLAHLTRRGTLSSAEIRLLQFLTAEATFLPESLRDFIGKAASVKARAA